MLKTNNLRNRVGFTLIELLVVIGVLAVIAAGVIALIDPTEKLRQANDVKAQNDVSQIVTALQSYAAQNSGYYPCVAQAAGCPQGAAGGSWSTAIVNSGELTVLPTAPSGYTAYGYSANVAGGNPTAAKAWTQVFSKRNGGPTAQYWVWCSWTGTIVNLGATAPNATYSGACQ